MKAPEPTPSSQRHGGRLVLPGPCQQLISFWTCNQLWFLPVFPQPSAPFVPALPCPLHTVPPSDQGRATQEEEEQDV